MTTMTAKDVAKDELLAGNEASALAVLLADSPRSTPEGLAYTLKELKLSLREPTIGDVLVCSWGYDQTNIDWYQVVAVTKASVRIRKISGKVTDERVGTDVVVPDVGNFLKPYEYRYRDDPSDPDKLEPDRDPKPEYTAKGLMKRVNRSRTSGYSVSMNSFSSAYLWDGDERNATASGYGH